MAPPHRGLFPSSVSLLTLCFSSSVAGERFLQNTLLPSLSLFASHSLSFIYFWIAFHNSSLVNLPNKKYQKPQKTCLTPQCFPCGLDTLVRPDTIMMVSSSKRPSLLRLGFFLSTMYWLFWSDKHSSVGGVIRSSLSPEDLENKRESTRETLRRVV